MVEARLSNSINIIIYLQSLTVRWIQWLLSKLWQLWYHGGYNNQEFNAKAAWRFLYTGEFFRSPYFRMRTCPIGPNMDSQISIGKTDITGGGTLYTNLWKYKKNYLQTSPLLLESIEVKSINPINLPRALWHGCRCTPSNGMISKDHPTWLLAWLLGWFIIIGPPTLI